MWPSIWPRNCVVRKAAGAANCFTASPMLASISGPVNDRSRCLLSSASRLVSQSASFAASNAAGAAVLFFFCSLPRRRAGHLGRCSPPPDTGPALVARPNYQQQQRDQHQQHHRRRG